MSQEDAAAYVAQLNPERAKEIADDTKPRLADFVADAKKQNYDVTEAELKDALSGAQKGLFGTLGDLADSVFGTG